MTVLNVTLLRTLGVVCVDQAYCESCFSTLFTLCHFCGSAIDADEVGVVVKFDAASQPSAELSSFASSSSRASRSHARDNEPTSLVYHVRCYHCVVCLKAQSSDEKLYCGKQAGENGDEQLYCYQHFVEKVSEKVFSVQRQ